MKAFFNVLTALLAAAGVVLITMKVIEAISSSDRDKKHLAFTGKVELPKLGKRTKLGEIKDSLSDEIEDFRFSSADDDLFSDIGEDIRDFAEDAVDEAAGIFEDISDAAEDFFEDAADELGNIADDAADSVEEAVEDAAEFVEDISEDDLDKLLGGND